MKRKPETPRSQVRSALRKLWLRSRERATALKRDHYTCQECGAKQSRARGREVKVEVHHSNEIPDWDKIMDYVYRHLLVQPEHLETLCRECHEEVTKKCQERQICPSGTETKEDVPSKEG